jgi:hypothetical protein
VKLSSFTSLMAASAISRRTSAAAPSQFILSYFSRYLCASEASAKKRASEASEAIETGELALEAGVVRVMG